MAAAGPYAGLSTVRPPISGGGDREASLACKERGSAHVLVVVRPCDMCHATGVDAAERMKMADLLPLVSLSWREAGRGTRQPGEVGAEGTATAKVAQWTTRSSDAPFPGSTMPCPSKKSCRETALLALALAAA